MENHQHNKSQLSTQHLRRFYQPATTQAPYPDPNPPELCPPHWRLQHQDRSLRTRLRALLRGDWPQDLMTQRIRQSTPEARSDDRPTAMRMKDSDDYITARAANPRTGLISPSVGTRTPCTPDSPGEALKRYSVDQESPTPTHKPRRPSLCRANEGRKISTGSAQNRAAGDKPQQLGYVPGAFPGTITSRYVEDQSDSDSTRALSDDQFVVHMPSAREPQPFSYPGYTAKQIEALEHYRRKARRVSSDGYDRRLFQAQSSCKIYSDNHDCTCEDEHATNTSPSYDRQFVPYNDESYTDRAYEDVEPPRLTVRKRANARVTGVIHHRENETARVPGIDPELHSATRSNNKDPLMAPRTTKTSHSNNRQDQFTSLSGSVVRTTKPAEKNSATVVDRQILQNLKSPMDSAPRSCTVANTHTASDQYYLDENEALPVPSRQPPDSLVHSTQCEEHTQTDLSKLPRVRLVRPEHASVPKGGRRDASGHSVQRQCSFGCQRESRNGECAQRRKTSDVNTVIRRSSVLFERPHQQDADVDRAEMIMDFATSTLSYLGSLQVPRIDTLEILRAPDIPAKEKLEALKTVVSLAGHVLAVCTLLAMLWKLGAALMHLLEVIFWPLAVPLRMLRWIAGLG